jgi:CPA2 family monovalent cation:H+ antiporter-2
MVLAATDSTTAYVVSLVVILSTSALVAIVMQRMRLAVIPAYLIAGVIVGPGGLGLVYETEALDSISQLAVVLLMFGIGLHMQLSTMGHGLARMITAGVVSWLASAFVGWPVAMAFGLGPAGALTLCMALSMSSTAVVLRIIGDRGELRHNSGRLALSILVVQDLMVILVMAALPGLSRWAGGQGGPVMEKLDIQDLPTWIEYLSDALISVGGIGVMLVIGKLLLPKLLHEAARERSGEVMMIVSVAIAIAAGLITQAAGFSIELGAFMAGFLLAATPFRHHLSGQIAPLRDLFMAVFFTSLGMRVDPDVALQWWWVILLGGVTMVAIKAVTIALSCWSVGATPSVAVRVGLALAQAGEFSLVLISTAEDRGIFASNVADIGIAIVVISLILTPLMVRAGHSWSIRWDNVGCAPWISGGLSEESDVQIQKTEGPLVIVGGFGQVGQAIGRALEDAGIRFSIIELKTEIVRRESGVGREILYGDVSNLEVLESAGLEFADALVLTMPDEPSVLRACAVARRKRTDLFLAVRISLTSHGRIAEELGADHIVIEEIEAARALQQAIIAHCGGDRGVKLREALANGPVT